ncbi:MAG: TlpA family protein disulfide reductase [Armatimonadetes bacterium]|nr:TlpA family protein disulfide reductase [Armatimonadota bacterium]
MIFELLIAVAVGQPTTDDVQLQMLTKGATAIIGSYMPQRLYLSPDPPPGLLRSSAIGIVEFGVLNFGPKGKEKDYFIGLAEDGTMYVDSNGDGDLWDDPEPIWTAVEPGGSTSHRGSFNIDLELAGNIEHLTMNAYRFDATAPSRAAYADIILYYCDYAMVGEIELGGKSYNMMLADRMAKGDFTGEGSQFLIDINGDGKYDSRFELYDPNKPFNIGGTTYDLDLTYANDCVLGTEVSSATVAELVAPPNLNVGQIAISFEATATDGKEIKFPETYKGKLVMLDFWATWCGPCIAELPNVKKAYAELHDQGFEILSISLDQADKAQVLADFTKKNDMPWRQIYDGMYWNARIAKLYGIRSIPAVLLIDGDTGEILADVSTLRGPGITKTIADALAKKRGK